MGKVTNLTLVDLCHQQNTFELFCPKPGGDIASQSWHILKRWSCIKTHSSSWKELYEVENRWRPVLLWEFIRNKTFPRGSVFSGCLLPRLPRDSQVFGKVDSAGVQHHTICEQKKRWEHATRAGGDPWQMSKNPATDGGRHTSVFAQTPSCPWLVISYNTRSKDL